MSSTIADLTEERRAVLDWLRLARHQAVDSYLPDSDTVRDSCLDDVAGCDLYVLIAGHRYGSQPEQENPGGLSITHLEFRRAGQCGIPRVALLRTSIPDVSLSDLQDPARAPLVLAFRDEVAGAVRPAEFSDLKGLIQGLSTGIQGELDKQAKRDERPPGPAGRALRLAPRPVYLAGREDLLAGLDARLAGGDGGGPSPAPWLLLFDNAPDRASVARFVPPAGPGLVLVTSRNPNWPSQALEVPVLDPLVAGEFLVSRTGDADRRAALELAGVLGGLPLALEQAAAYVQASGESMAGYASLFGQRRADLTGRGEPTGSSQTVATTWRLAFEDLNQGATGATGLLRLLAFCAPEAVPLRLLLQPRPGLAEELGEDVAPVLVPLLEDRLAADDAIVALRRYSLVTPADGGSVSVHRLVQAVTADQMPADQARQWRQATAALIGAALPHPAEPWIAEKWPVYAMLLPHVQAAAPADSPAAAAIADYLGYAGNYAVARDSVERVVEARERRYGPEHPGTVTARTMLAHWTAQAGQAAAGRDQLAGLLPVAERVLGPEHRDTLFLRRELAWWTGDAGDPVAARDQWAALVPVCERVLGPEHPETLTVRQGLAGATGRAGDAVAARDQAAALVPVFQRVLGPEHTGTLATQANLAGWTGQAGDPDAARRLFAEVLTVHERVFGPEHPGTLNSRRNVAGFTGEAGDAAAARDQLAELLPSYERVLGPDHPDTLTTRAWLASWTGDAGDPAAARDLYAALLPARERVLGPEHPDTLATRTSLAHWTERSGG